MAETTASVQTVEDESLKQIFDEGMKLFNLVESTNEAISSEPVQFNIKKAIGRFEKATELVSLSEMFSSNEQLEELPTETLQYLLLPALLGQLTLKLSGRPRTDLINVAEIYFKDFLQRCKDYGVTDVEIPQPANPDSTCNANKMQTEKAKITSMVLTRDAKIKRYKEMQNLKQQLETLSQAMNSPNVDDSTKREYFTTMLNQYINQSLDELASIDQERPILEYMANHSKDMKPQHRQQPRTTPLMPVIITRDAVQKAVFGAGYPSLPTLTVEEFYNQRVKDGTWPASAANIPHSTIQSAEVDADEADQIRKEQQVENEDPEELARQRNMDEYKDDHRRGWGNRHNRS